MEYLKILFELALSIGAVIKNCIPRISVKLKIIIIASILAVGLLVFFFNTNFCKHWRHFDQKKIYMISGQLPHTLREGSQNFHKYILTLENNYSEEVEVNNVRLTINSRMPILRYSILLSDIKEESIKANIKDQSELQVTIDSMSGGKIISFEYECSSIVKKNLHERVESEQPDILRMIEYDLFGQQHLCDCWKGLKTPRSKTIYDRKDILFEKVVALDYRKIPQELKYDYQLAHYSFEENSREIEIFFSDDKHLNITYDDMQGSLKYKSIEIVKEKVSILRLMSFKDGYFLHETTIPTKKVKQASKKKFTWNGVFEKLDQSYKKKSDEPLATRIFWLLREKGSKISLECPGKKCLHFELGSLEEKHGGLWQQIFLSGEGFGIKRDPEKNIIMSMGSLMEMRGALPGFDFKTGRMYTKILLSERSYFEIFLDIAYVKFWVLDTKSDSLRIKLEVRPKQ